MHSNHGEIPHVRCKLKLTAHGETPFSDKAQVQSLGAQALRGTCQLPHICTMPLEQGAQWSTLQRHLQGSGKASQPCQSYQLWTRAIAEVDVGRSRVQDSMQLCQLLQTEWAVLRDPLLNDVTVKRQPVRRQGK